jgi:hypothetical protein
MPDIVDELRKLPGDRCRPCLEAADEIERLRVNLRLADAGFTFGPPTLTEAEREAIAWAINKTAQSYDDAEGGPIKREAMRGLLQRTK